MSMGTIRQGKLISRAAKINVENGNEKDAITPGSCVAMSTQKFGLFGGFEL